VRPALGGGRGGERMGHRHGCFHAMHLRNAQAFDASSSAECCLSLEFRNTGGRLRVDNCPFVKNHCIAVVV
jgi:hypothetical protein